MESGAGRFIAIHLTGQCVGLSLGARPAVVSVVVGGYLGRQQSNAALATDLANHARCKTGTIALMHGSHALQVGQSEIAGAVASVVSADQREQSGVLRNGHKLTIAKRPAPGGEVAREHSDFRNKWIRHSILFFSSIPAREDALERDAIYHYQIRLQVVMRLRASGVATGSPNSSLCRRLGRTAIPPKTRPGNCRRP